MQSFVSKFCNSNQISTLFCKLLKIFQKFFHTRPAKLLAKTQRFHVYSLRILFCPDQKPHFYEADTGADSFKTLQRKRARERSFKHVAQKKSALPAPPKRNPPFLAKRRVFQTRQHVLLSMVGGQQPPCASFRIFSKKTFASPSASGPLITNVGTSANRPLCAGQRAVQPQTISAAQPLSPGSYGQNARWGKHFFKCSTAATRSYRGLQPPQ